jgi:hypothetical protein
MITAIKKHIKPAKLDKNSKKHTNDPFIVKKIQSAKKLMAKIQLPKEFNGNG